MARDYTFSLYGDVKPNVELDSYEPVEIKMPSEEATQEDVDIQLHALQDYYNDFETVDRAAKQGDFVMVRLASTADGAPVDSLTNEPPGRDRRPHDAAGAHRAIRRHEGG